MHVELYIHAVATRLIQFMIMSPCMHTIRITATLLKMGIYSYCFIIVLLIVKRILEVKRTVSEVSSLCSI